MGIFIKSGILHTLKFHLHTLSCHFWLNLWVLFLSTSLGAQLLKCFHSWDGSILRSWFHMIGVSDGSLDGYSWMQLLVLCSRDSNGNSAFWWLWFKKKKKKAWHLVHLSSHYNSWTPDTVAQSVRLPVPKCQMSYRDFSAWHFCFLFVSLLSHFWLIHFFPPTPALWTISRPLSISMCSITQETANVGSSYNRMRGPGIECWFSDRSNCSHWSLTLTLTSENLSLYTILLLYWSLYNYAANAARDSNYCRTRCRQSQLRFVLSPLLLHPPLLGTFQSVIPLFTLTWPAKHSPNQGWESTHSK